MKGFFKIAVLIVAAVSLWSCEEINERVLPHCTGRSGDLLIVADTAYYNNATGDAIKQVFAQQQVGLPQREASFDLIHVPHRAFSRIFHTTRNIVMVNIEPESKIKLTVTKNVWADKQLVITITAPSGSVAAETVAKNEEVLLNYFNDKEIERLQEHDRLNSNSKNAQHLRENFKLGLNIDELYVVAEEAEDFIWLRKETDIGGHPLSQGILIYTYPYISDSTFDVGELVKKRNYYTEKYVHGKNEGSYMLSYEEYVPNQKEVSLTGVYLNELRGLWHMKKGFMGGPFVNYSMVDEKRNRVICVDGYVYGPKFDKREYLREQEALIKSITY